MPNFSHHTAGVDSPPAAAEPNGGLSSERIADGSPASAKNPLACGFQASRRRRLLKPPLTPASPTPQPDVERLPAPHAAGTVRSPKTPRLGDCALSTLLVERVSLGAAPHLRRKPYSFFGQR
jgi:hypothetical protein